MMRKPTDDIANWRLQQENTSKPFPYVFPQMPPRFRRCCAFAKAVFLIQWGCFAASCVCSMVLFIPVVIWGRNMGMSAMIENRPFLAFFIVVAAISLLIFCGCSVWIYPETILAVSLLRTSISILCSDKRG